MRVRTLHPWDLTPSEAVRVQERLRRRIRTGPIDRSRLERVAGCDVAVAGRCLVAVVVVLDLEGLELLEVAEGRSPASFPYVPGLLSFREIPALIDAFERIRSRPDLVLCDGQGLAHPRRFGLACHLGLLLDLPSVGVAKSRLVGQAREPGPRRGCSTEIRDHGEVVGRLVRTRDSVRPLYISVGHRIGLDDAVRIVLRTGGGYRLPEPTRLADQRVGRLARSLGASPAGR